MSQYPPGPPANYPPGGPPGGPPPTQQQPGWGQQPPPQQQPGWGQQPPQPPQQPGWGQPGQPGPPGYPAGGPPGGPGGGGGGGGGGGAKILIGVAVVAVLAVGAFFLLSGDDSASASSPTDAVESVFSAMRDGDCEQVMGLVTEATWSEGGTVSREDALAECESNTGGFADMPGDVELGNVELVSEEGDNATVSATLTAEGTTVDLTFPVVKESGDWKVDLEGVSDGSGATPGGDPPEEPTDDELPEVSIPEDLDIPDVSLPDDLEDFDPSDIDCSILEDPELIEQCEAGLDAGFGG